MGEKFKVSQKWLTRDGKEVVIFGVSPKGVIAFELEGLCYLANANGVRYSNEVHSFDLVQLVEELSIQSSTDRSIEKKMLSPFGVQS
jgi:hypothetical protein